MGLCIHISGWAKGTGFVCLFVDVRSIDLQIFEDKVYGNVQLEKKEVLFVCLLMSAVLTDF